jgi:hypothetical protein
VSEKRIVAVIAMGQSGLKTRDVCAAIPNAIVQAYGILDGMTLKDVKRDAWPQEKENFIVTSLSDGKERPTT